MLSVYDSLNLAGHNLLNILNPEDNYLPYWQGTVYEDYTAELKPWWPAHNIGRWWDALTLLETTIGFEIPEFMDHAMQVNVVRFFENPDHIPLDPNASSNYAGTGTELLWDIHSLREGVLALNALARYRKSEWAADMGRKMVVSLDSKLNADGTWNLESFDAYQKRGSGIIHNADPCDTHGRMIEALIWFYETTGDPIVMSFIHRLAEFHFEHTTQAGGQIPPGAKVDHTHSYLGTLRGLLLYGELTRQHTFIERVRETYSVNVPQVVHESGYTSHNMVVESFGETTSPGDAAQLALWLGKMGHMDFADDAERLVRARLLPSQIIEFPPLTPKVNTSQDRFRDLETRIVGGYGGCHKHPHGAKTAVTDVTAADVHTLVDVYRHIATDTNGSVEVFFHLDYVDDIVEIRTQSSERRSVEIELSDTRNLSIRIPKWTNRNDLVLTKNGERQEPIFTGDFAQVGRVQTGECVELSYHLPEKTVHEVAYGEEYEIRWRGDEVMSVSPNTTFFPFYENQLV